MAENKNHINFDKKEVDELFLDIATLIENGTYFEEAKKWYCQKYILVYVQRRFLFLISILLLISCYVTVKECGTYFPLEKKVPLAVENSDPSSYYFELFKLSNPNEDIRQVNEGLMRYFVKEFVINFESYDFKNNFEQIEKNRLFIKNYGEKSLLEQFDERMSNINIDGFKLKYHKSTKREIKVENVKILNANNQEDIVYFKTIFPKEDFLETKDSFTAIVKFTAYERNVKGNFPFKYIAFVKIKFPFVVYNKSKKDFEKIEFNILDYEVVALKP